MSASFLFLFMSGGNFKMCLFLKQSFLSFGSWGQLVGTEYILKLVTEHEGCLTFNGNNLHERFPRIALLRFYSVLKGDTTEFPVLYTEFSYGNTTYL